MRRCAAALAAALAAGGAVPEAATAVAAFAAPGRRREAASGAERGGGLDGFLERFERDMAEGWRKEQENVARRAEEEAVRWGRDRRRSSSSNSSSSSNDSNSSSSSSNDSNSQDGGFSGGNLLADLEEGEGLSAFGGGEFVAAASTLSLSSLTVVQLRDRLREAGLPVSGRKAELVERLLRSVAEP